MHRFDKEAEFTQIEVSKELEVGEKALQGGNKWTP